MCSVTVSVREQTLIEKNKVKFVETQSDVAICRVDMELMTPALKIWRNAVVTSQSSSQLAMCLFMLYDCVAWEKSIMKVVSG